MTRNEHDEIEATANVALAGLLAGDGELVGNQEELVKRSFDIAEAFQAERKKRIGDKPPYEC